MVSKPNVLFVNIGWAERYDGKHQIEGGMVWVQDHLGNPKEISEGEAFLPEQDGRVRCGAGLGWVTPNEDIDVIFVARNPDTSNYEVVGFYRGPTFSHHDTESQNGRKLTWATASTEMYMEISGTLRPPVQWPKGRHMRRWVKMLGVIYYPELNSLYEKLISLASEQV